MLIRRTKKLRKMISMRQDMVKLALWNALGNAAAKWHLYWQYQHWRIFMLINSVKRSQESAFTSHNYYLNLFVFGYTVWANLHTFAQSCDIETTCSVYAPDTSPKHSHLLRKAFKMIAIQHVSCYSNVPLCRCLSCLSFVRSPFYRSQSNDYQHLFNIGYLLIEKKCAVNLCTIFFFG